MVAATALAAGPAGARLAVERLPGSLIREVANAGMGLGDVLAFWFGEPDLPTPKFICDAAAAAMAAGQTFYTANRGLPELREALSAYMGRLHGRAIAEERIVVTASGMAAVNLAQQVLTEAGDNVVVQGPIWPNLMATVALMGGEPRLVPLQFANQGWRLDLDRLFAACDARTRAIVVNSPSNPTGWVMRPEEQRAILEFARKRGIWIIADDVYVRLCYSRPVAPSFAELAEPEDRLVIVNSFSKSWCMTGWRLGWLTVPPKLAPVVERAIEFHHSCAAEFSQRAGIVAVEQGEPFVADLVARYRSARDLACERLVAMPRVRLHVPEGAFYVFFQVAGMRDSLEFCKRLVREARVGLAPGAAFGPEGEGFIRLCFASTLPRLDEGLSRLATALQ